MALFPMVTGGGTLGGSLSIEIDAFGSSTGTTSGSVYFPKDLLDLFTHYKCTNYIGSGGFFVRKGYSDSDFGTQKTVNIEYSLSDLDTSQGYYFISKGKDSRAFVTFY